jgi:hypothetical protein
MSSSKESYPIPKTDLNVFQESVVWAKEWSLTLYYN